MQSGSRIERPSPKQAILANDLAAVEAWLTGGGDADAVLERGRPPLGYACTEAMLALLLQCGADPRVRYADGRSVLDDIAREGQLEMARLILQAAPELATEERALMAADHPETEALIRSVARKEVSSSAPAESRAARLRARRVVPSDHHAAPAFKGAQRYHFPHRPGHVSRHDLPGWAEGRVAESDIPFRGPRDALLCFDASGRPSLLTPDDTTTLAVPPLPYPYEHAFDETGEHFFFGYGQGRALGVATATGEEVLDLDLPGAPWGTVMVATPGESLQGHMYPARMAVFGQWLGLVSLERIHFVPFGENAKLPMQWFTCQLGTCVAPVLGGRIVIVGARAGSSIFGVSGTRIVRLMEIEHSLYADEPSPVLGQLRMLLRVHGMGHDDIRSLSVDPLESGTVIRAAGHGGFDTRELRVEGLVIQPEQVESDWPTRPEIVDAFELDGEVRIRVSPIGRGEVREYAIEGLESLWHAAFGEVDVDLSVVGPAAIASPLPAPYDPPHKDIGTLSYPDVGPAGFGFGHRVSRRPGFWNSFIIDPAGVHPLKPHWFSGVTYHAYHPTRKKMLASTGSEAIEIDAETRAWSSRTFPKPLRGLCYFEDGIAVLLTDELWLVADLQAEPADRIATTTRDASMEAVDRGRVLWVPVGLSDNVFLARRDGELVVVGRLEETCTGFLYSPDGDFLELEQGVVRLVGLADAIADAEPLEGRSLIDCGGPIIERIASR